MLTFHMPSSDTELTTASIAKSDRFLWAAACTPECKDSLFELVNGCFGTSTNDCIATQRCPTPEILIASPVISRTTSEPSGERARMMVAIVAGCCSVRTFRDCHNSIAFTIGILHQFIRAYLYHSYFLFS